MVASQHSAADAVQSPPGDRLRVSPNGNQAGTLHAVCYRIRDDGLLLLDKSNFSSGGGLKGAAEGACGGSEAGVLVLTQTLRETTGA